MSRSAQQIKQELIRAYQKDSALIQEYFRENPGAIKFKKEKGAGAGPTCSIVRNPESGRLLLVANENLISEGSHIAKVGKRKGCDDRKYGDLGTGAEGLAKYALDIETQELCVVKIGYRLQKEHKIASAAGITQPGFDTLITRDDKGYVVLRYLGNTLGNMQNTGEMRSMELSERLKIVQILLQKIDRLHSSGYVHGDTISWNITIERNPTGQLIDVHLIDFGKSKDKNDFLRSKKHDELPEVIPDDEQEYIRLCCEFDERAFKRECDIDFFKAIPCIWSARDENALLTTDELSILIPGWSGRWSSNEDVLANLQSLRRVLDSGNVSAANQSQSSGVNVAGRLGLFSAEETQRRASAAGQANKSSAGQIDTSKMSSTEIHGRFGKR